MAKTIPKPEAATLPEQEKLDAQIFGTLVEERDSLRARVDELECLLRQSESDRFAAAVYKDEARSTLSGKLKEALASRDAMRAALGDAVQAAEELRGRLLEASRER